MPRPVPTAAMPDRRKRPPLTPARAILLELLARYGELGYSRTLLEVQKLAYFLQESGQDLRLHYVRGTYGPYAHNLDKALQQLEGHFIVGLGDAARPRAEIDLLPGAVEEAQEVLAAQPESRERFDRVAGLIEDSRLRMASSCWPPFPGWSGKRSRVPRIRIRPRPPSAPGLPARLISSSQTTSARRGSG